MVHFINNEKKGHKRSLSQRRLFNKKEKQHEKRLRGCADLSCVKLEFLTTNAFQAVF